MAQTRLPAAHWTETSLARLFTPVQHFVSQSQSSGVVLFLMTLLALILANSPLAETYNGILGSYVGITVGPWVLEETVLHWVNDGLMAIFFFVVGLEIKRELLVGELSSARAAALPIIAATGGALVPAGIYALLNVGGPGAPGWGVPMATDIAFALGCLAILGSRVPFALKIFVTAVAIVDDLIAVLVIAIFYSAELNMGALGLGLGVLALLAACNWQGIRSPVIYSALGVIVWLAFLKSGVHATIAGVLIALTIPARYRIDEATFRERAHGLLHTFEPHTDPSAAMITDERQQHAVIALEELCEQVQAPLQKIEHELQAWVTWLIMPVFALANAGIALGAVQFDAGSLPMALGVILGLVLGKPIGLMAASWLAVRSGVASLPQGVTWAAMGGAGALAGIGFTMSIFIATLAFESPEALATIKLAILVASLIAGILGVMLLRRLPAAG